MPNYNDDELKKQMYLKALENLSGQQSPTPQAQVADTGGVIADFIKKRRGGKLMEHAPALDQASNDPYDLLKLKEEENKQAGRIFTPGQGWKTLPRG